MINGVRMCTSPLLFHVAQSFGGRGMTEFYLSEPYCTFIKLLRDGIAVTGESLYERLLSNEISLYSDHVAIDFRTPEAQQAKDEIVYPQATLYTVLLSDDYKSAEVMYMGTNIASVRVHGNTEAACIQILNRYKMN
jgi:hypothetical protein